MRERRQNSKEVETPQQYRNKQQYPPSQRGSGGRNSRPQSVDKTTQKRQHFKRQRESDSTGESSDSNGDDEDENKERKRRVEK